jgi:hypothetical protein
MTKRVTKSHSSESYDDVLEHIARAVQLCIKNQIPLAVLEIIVENEYQEQHGDNDMGD